MFSVNQKRMIAEQVQIILRKTNHPELPDGEIQFLLHVDGAESWSWADIRNNGAVTKPTMNPWNEAQEKPAPLEAKGARGFYTPVCSVCGKPPRIGDCFRCRCEGYKRPRRAAQEKGGEL